MRVLAAIGRVLIWVFTVLMLFFQIGTAISIRNYDTAVGAASSYEIGPMVLITGLMLAAVIVFFALKRGRAVPLIVAAVLGVCFIILAHSLHVYYGPPTSGVVPSGSYLTLWRALYKHAAPALIPVFMLPVWWVHRQDRLEAEAAAEAQDVPSVLGGLSDYTMSSLDEEK